MAFVQIYIHVGLLTLAFLGGVKFILSALYSSDISIILPGILNKPVRHYYCYLCIAMFT